jgi:Ca2+-binding EF-hand superfamily protein
MTTTSIGAVSSNSDLQAMLALLYKSDESNTNGLSKADLSKINEEQNSQFVKSLEEEFNLIDKDSNGLLSKDEVLDFTLDKQLGMPAGFKIQDATQQTNEKNLYQNIADKISESIISQLDTNKDGKISDTEIKEAMQNLSKKLSESSSSVEVAGKVANNNSSITKVQNMAGNFIQKLIDNYNSGGIVAKVANAAINSFA